MSTAGISAKRTGTRAASALTAAAIAAATLGSAPAANATCASFFGFGGGADCSSTLTTIAIAIGPGAQAKAQGIFGATLALGTNAQALSASDGFDFGVAVGPNSLAVAGGLFGIAAGLGPYAYAQTNGTGKLGNLGLNLALNIAPINKSPLTTTAAGLGSVALNLFGANTSPVFHAVYGVGIVGIGVNVGGKDNDVVANGKILNTAFNVFGSRNSVAAGMGSGSLALAGSIFQKDQTVLKQKPGFNINGFRFPKTAAATHSPRKAAATARSARASASERVRG